MTSALSSALAANADAGIDEAVREIDEDVGERDEHGVEDRGPHDDGVVALGDRLDKLAPEPWAPKIDSMMIEPVTRSAAAGPRMVTIGISALRSMWARDDVPACARPLARAVRM